MPTRCVDRMNAEIRFHTDILNPKMVKCRKGLEERDVTGATHFLAQLQKGLHLHHSFSRPCRIHALICVMAWHES